MSKSLEDYTIGGIIVPLKKKLEAELGKKKPYGIDEALSVARSVGDLSN